MRTARHPIVLSILVGLLARSTSAFPPHPVPSARELMQQQKYAEAAAALEAYLATNRFDGRAWSNLGVCLYWTKDYDRAREAGAKAIELGFNPAGEMYNIACMHALQGKPEEALAWLTRAYDSGFVDDIVVADADLNSLRNDPRFISLTGLNPPALASAADQWAWDLDFLVRRMEQMHWDLYAHVSEKDFRAAIDQLKIDAPTLDLQRNKARLGRILAMVGDGHTAVSAFARGETTVPRAPLQMYLFTDGLFITAAPPHLRDLIGAQVLQVGSIDTEEARRRIRPYCAADNAMTPLVDFPMRCTNRALLQEIGAVTTEGTEIPYTLRLPGGETRAVSLAPAPLGFDGLKAAFPDLVRASDLAPAPKPLYLQNPEIPLWMTHLESPNAVYFGFQQVADNPDRSFAEVIADLEQLIRDKNAEHLIIDMRANPGGNTGLVMPLVHALIRNDRINHPGRLFVIIGRRTFSAAQNTANMIEIHTNATFVGEPTGSRPNFVGESTHIDLPYSGLRIYCSSRYWQFLSSTDERTWISPQIAAELSSQDYFANRDPCMDAILARIASGSAAARSAAAP